MEQRTIGLKYIALRDASGNLITLGDTVENTAKLSKEEDKIALFYGEENEDPIDTEATKGQIYVEWGSFNYDPAVLAKILGGSVVLGAFQPDDVVNEVDCSIEICTETDVVIRITKARLSVSFNLDLNGLAVGELKLKAKVLKAVGVPMITIETGASPAPPPEEPTDPPIGNNSFPYTFPFNLA